MNSVQETIMKSCITLTYLMFLLLFANGSLFGQNLKWAKSFGGKGFDGIGFMKIDNKGNIYVCGSFKDTLEYHIGNEIKHLNCIGDEDAFFSKLDSNGNIIWIKSLPAGIDGNNYFTLAEMVIDRNSNILLYGEFVGTIDFDPGASVFNLNCLGAVSDLFVLKLDSNGNFVWVKQIGYIEENPNAGSLSDGGLAIDFNLNIFITGTFGVPIDFDPGPNIFYLSPKENAKTFILKLDQNGNFIWVKQIGGAPWGNGNNLAVDKEENIIFGGRLNHYGDFDPSENDYILGSGIQFNIPFICKLDKDGKFNWAKCFKGVSPNNDGVNSITTDNNLNVIAVGSFSNKTDFDPGPNIYYLNGTGPWDTFILKLDKNGDFVWAKEIGHQGTLDECNDLAVDKIGNVYYSGKFYKELDINPGLDTFKLTPIGSNANTYFSKLDYFGNFLWAKQLSKCGSISIYVNESENLFLGGSFADTVDFDFPNSFFLYSNSGSSDAFIAKYGNCKTTTSIINIFACDSYTWNGNTFTTDGTFTFKTLNIEGCDSIIVLNIKINKSTSSENEANACNKYIWNGNTYTESGVYTYTTLNSVGCDSIVLLNLTINKIDTSVTQIGNTLTSNTIGATYQWLNCYSGYARIIGETSQSFTPIMNGSFAVEVKNGGCIDTSSCHKVILNGVLESNFGTKFSLYPNPSNGEINIDLGELFSEVEMIISSIDGKQIEHKKFNSTSFIKHKIDAIAGTYLLKVKAGNYSAVIKVIIQ